MSTVDTQLFPFDLNALPPEEHDEEGPHGLHYTAQFCPEAQDPCEMVEWKTVDAVLKDAEGNVIFEQKDVEAPSTWSDRAIRIVAQKYFRGQLGSPQRESSVREIVLRVANTIHIWAVEQDYFDSAEDALRFRNDLVYLLLTQRGAFNSPVWFNLGVADRDPQCSACFILAVDDNMTSISELQRDETKVFKLGSGCGTNLSQIRSSKELLHGGGTASGPVSFMRGYDAWAGVIKSGGTTRRAAKMAILNVDHPDIIEFIDSKMIEEKKAAALVAAGFSADFDDPNGAYASVAFQNANHSVRVSDAFMDQVQRALDHPDEELLWDLYAVTSDEVIARVPVLDLWNKICDAIWMCGDPGIQFDDTINQWHTCPSEGRINASNPCQPGFAPVLTPEGIRTFDDIDVGDRIWSGTCWTVITAKKRTGVKDVYRYHTRAGIFTGTEEHRVLSRGDKVEVQYAETIDINTFKKPQAWPSVTPTPQDVLDGLMLGDGYPVYANNGTLVYPVLCIGDKDQCYFESEVAALINPVPFDKKVHRVEQTSLSPEEMPRTYLRRIPQRFHQGNFLTVRGFLRGLYSANGSICGGRVTLKATSFDVIEAVQQMLSSLGIRSYYTTNKPKTVTFSNGDYLCKQSYDLNITADRTLFRDLVGFIHPEKTLRLTEACELQPRPYSKTNYDVVDVEFVGTLPVWDITVEDEAHTYWSGGLLVSNCAEFVFLDDSACNLASLNILKFRNDDGKFDRQSFMHAVNTFVIAQDVLINNAAYPTERLTQNSKRYRPLGLGYANLGAYLMSIGLPYDSDDGRRVAAEITSVMSAQAYLTSTKMAEVKGYFEAYTANCSSMLRVIEQHRDAAVSQSLESACIWEEVLEQGELYGFRNAQVSLLAPTGTIGFLMDCDTTGIEPELSLYKVKQLVGGGTIVMENRSVERALEALEYSPSKQAKILTWLGEHHCLDACPQLSSRHLAVFDCAIPSEGTRSLHLDAHLKMTAAVQPFLSGAISKTMNVPVATPVEEISRALIDAWNLGIKSITLYRDNCKLSQPVSSTQRLKEEARPVRKKPKRHQTNMHRIKFEFGNTKGFMLVTPYEDTGMPGEVFVMLAKVGSTVSGLVEGWARAVSYCLQFGVPLETLVEKFSHTKFEPAGFSSDPDIQFAHSIYDALMRKLAAVFLSERISNGHTPQEAGTVEAPSNENVDNPSCMACGAITIRSGANCYKCPVCGNASGCG